MNDKGDGFHGNEKLHLETPTVYSYSISRHAGFDVYLKLDNLQIPGSFKIRGVGHLCQKAVKRGCTHIVCASGGNAGLAAAYSAHRLGIKATIVLPESTPAFVADKLRNLFNAEVLIVGKIWDESNKHALELAKDPQYEYVHPFDHPDLWEGHSSLITEVQQQLPCRPDAVVVSVGGGGLLNGILQGMSEVGWSDVPCIAMETVGADCLNASIRTGTRVTLPDITSIAKSLGSLAPSERTLELIKLHKPFHSVVIEDRDAVSACLKFADDHRMLVEPACGASLAAIYGPVISDLVAKGTIPTVQSVLIIVCGGSAITLQQMEAWKQHFDL